ncbi:hypothetical protein [Halovulum sp. GXIMD14793]
MHRKIITPAIVVLLAAIAWLLWQRDLPMRDTAVLGIGLAAVGLFGLGALSDLLYRKVDNAVSLGLLVLYLPWFLMTQPGCIPALLAATIFVVGLLISKTVRIGGAVIKLAALGFLWAGTEQIASFLVIMSVLLILVGLLKPKALRAAMAIAAAAAYVMLTKLEPLTGWIMPVS